MASNKVGYDIGVLRSSKTLTEIFDGKKVRSEEDDD